MSIKNKNRELPVEKLESELHHAHTQLAAAQARWDSLDTDAATFVERSKLASAITSLRGQVMALPKAIAVAKRQQAAFRELSDHAAALEQAVRTELDQLLNRLPTRANLVQLLATDMRAHALRSVLAAHGEERRSTGRAARELGLAFHRLASDLDLVLRGNDTKADLRDLADLLVLLRTGDIA